MRVFFCLSNMYVPLVLSLIESGKEDFVIITPQENLYKLFSQIYGHTKVIYLQPFESSSLNEKLFFLPRWFSYKRNMLRKLSFIKNSTIYFFFVAFGLLESWLIKKLSAENTIIYNPAISIENWPANTGFKARIKRKYIQWIYGVPVDAKLWAGYSYWTVSDKFLTAISAFLSDEQVNWKLVNKLTSSVFRNVGSQILYLTGGIVEEGFVDEEEFVNKSDALLLSLKKYNLLLKTHPRYPALYSEENEIKSIPGFIPINLMLDRFQVVIGYSSAVMFEAANQGCVSISLLDFYIEKGTQTKQSNKEYLCQNLAEGKLIYFPKNIQELNEIIRSQVNESD